MEIAEDEDLLREYRLDGTTAQQDLDVAGLLDSLRTGRPEAIRTGRPLGEAMQDDAGLAGDLRSVVEDYARWPAAAIAAARDWSAYSMVTGLGPGSGQAVVAIVREHPAVRGRLLGLPSELRVLTHEVLDVALTDRVELTEHAPFTPLPTPPVSRESGVDAVLTVALLERWPDADADAALALRPLVGSAAYYVVETTVADIDRLADDEELVETDLKHRCAFGVGVRTIAQVSALLTAAGFIIDDVTELGWDMHWWSLSRALTADQPVPDSTTRPVGRRRWSARIGP